MQHLKNLGLAVVAVAALMALAAAGVASAETTLCKETKDPCPAGQGYGVGQEIHAVSIATPEIVTEGGTKHAGHSGPAVTDGLGTVTCDTTIKGTIEVSTTPSGKAETTWSNCVGGAISSATSGIFTIHHDAEHNGTLTLEGFVKKVVQAGIPCYYTSEGVDGTLTAGNPAIIHITATTPKLDTATHDSSAFCPASSTTHATFEVTTPKPLYVTTGV